MTGTFAEYVVALAVFFAAHSLPQTTGLRTALIARMGRPRYLRTYSLLSGVLVAWVVAAALGAPYLPLWTQEPWMRLVPNLAMPFAAMLVAAGLAAPNPMSVTLAGAPFDPDRPGIVALTRHPVLWGFGLWAASHLLVNGDVAVGSLFLLMLAFALAGMPLADRRARARLGEPQWRRLNQRFPATPFAAILSGGTAMEGLSWRWLAAGIAAWLLLLLLHAPVIGVSPLPA